ncbi:hypothetical protein DFH94DRAFT_5785 [Russula ochroleuca]|uniref:Uncharacterized protein n=1 Tax=Russula ochroleuca TaxID=152965 RepID=A0A9P5N5N2_9AGAM|nr:hypothetical protein DFH94DRAFT_5785 [Russula ochroleuca]
MRLPGFVYLGSLSGYTPADLIRCYGSRRVLLVVRGVLFRDGSFSVSCRRVLCFCSIHSAPSHFVSVNPVSSSGSPTSPSPLYVQDAETRCVHTPSPRPPLCVRLHQYRTERNELFTGRHGCQEERPKRTFPSSKPHLLREGYAEREEGLDASCPHRIQVYFQRFIYDTPVVQVPTARNDEKTSTIPRRLRCKHRWKLRRGQCG